MSKSSDLEIHFVLRPLLQVLRVTAAVFLSVKVAVAVTPHEPLKPPASAATPGPVAGSSERIHQYVDAKARYLDDRRILNGMQTQYAVARGTEENPIRVWEKAVPPRAYASPDAKAYLARVTIALDRPPASAAAGYDPAYAATQFEVLRSDKILEPVIEKLNLSKELSGTGPQLNPEQVLAELKRQLVLKEKKETGILEIGILNSDAQLAANIANAIAEAYCDTRQNLMKEALAQSLRQFKDQIEKQQTKVTEESKTMGRLLTDFGLVDDEPLNPSAPIKPKSGQVK